MRSPLGGFLAALLLTGSPVALSAQVAPETRAADLAINSLLGATTAALRQALCRCLSWRGLAQGAAGGAVMSLGKQVVGRGFEGSGLVGRQVHALGISLIASVDRPYLLVLLPIGPLTIEVHPRTVDPMRARLDLTDLAILLGTAAASKTDFDWVATLSAGAPVLARPRKRMPLGYDGANGFAFVGTIVVAREVNAANRPQTLAHEAIHVLQWDALRHLGAHPAERAVVRRIPGVRSVGDFVDIGAVGPAVMWALGTTLPYERHPWEKEAYLLTQGHN